MGMTTVEAVEGFYETYYIYEPGNNICDLRSYIQVIFCYACFFCFPPKLHFTAVGNNAILHTQEGGWGGL